MAINTGLDNKRVGMNILFSCIAFVTNAFISIFITPYITASLGAEAYGFVKLANDFASYGSLVTMALNSMASRFIMLYRENDDQETARSYYSSITIANILLALCLLIPVIIFILCMHHVIDVPARMLGEVRLTFAWTLINFLICLAGTTFGNCFFLENRLDISSVLTSITSIIRAVFIVVAFLLDEPRISIMAFSSIVVTAIFMPSNIYFHKRLTPDLYFESKSYDLKKVKEVLASGIWNSVTRLSQILKTGLDLLVTNLLLGALDMGLLSVAKTIPNFISALVNTIGGAFTPNMMQLYAHGETDKLKQAIKSSMRVMAVFSIVPTAILISMGPAFYRLWVPEQPASVLNVLSILTIFSICIIGPMQPLYQVFTLTNKIRESSIVFIIEGIVSIVCTIVCVKIFGLGVYAIAGVSVGLSVIVALLYHLPMSAVYMSMPWHTFFPEIGKCVGLLGIQCAIGYMMNGLVMLEKSWLTWFLWASILGIIGVVLTALTILNKEERSWLVKKIFGKLRR